MVTEEQFINLGVGDVFYRGNTRYLIESIVHRVDNGLGYPVYRAQARTSTKRSARNSRGPVIEKGYITFLGLDRHRMERIVKKDKVRGTREYKSRRDYPFVSLQDQTELQRNERNDCSVHALATCLDIPYADAHSHMKAYGRINGKGARVHSAYPAKGLQYRANLTGFAFGRLVKSGLLPKRSIVLTKKHAVCVLSGVVYDGMKIGQNAAVLGWYSNGIA